MKDNKAKKVASSSVYRTVIGGVVGATIGYLSNPKTGKRIMSRIESTDLKQKSKNLGKTTMEKISNIKDYGAERSQQTAKKLKNKTAGLLKKEKSEDQENQSTSNEEQDLQEVNAQDNNDEQDLQEVNAQDNNEEQDHQGVNAQDNNEEQDLQEVNAQDNNEEQDHQGVNAQDNNEEQDHQEVNAQDNNEEQDHQEQDHQEVNAQDNNEEQDHQEVNAQDNNEEQFQILEYENRKLNERLKLIEKKLEQLAPLSEEEKNDEDVVVDRDEKDEQRPLKVSSKNNRIKNDKKPKEFTISSNDDTSSK
ncbi:hypothetical protein [Fictibacillus terranigra]|uniref:YtxH domain-containing protein n=1 Tax=Fictibacillus terranigra TaxID=3058424 RepID=A0ABT8E4Y9_9BACL|nr:hypothetical protein [Fictibacillus sp. CENA-BCM004]MDN4072974.1 hypothetical protein [Fictibacillus sp. CENA-BCM004]